MLLEQFGMVGHLGKRSRSFAKEKQRAFNRIVSDVYPQPYMSLEMRRDGFKHLIPGLALDLTVADPKDDRPWDFSRHAKREKARRFIRESKPILLIGSPMCTAFSTWQRFNFAKTQRPDMCKAYKEACKNMEFVSQLYHDQVAEALYFLHEHPMSASSWDLDCIQRQWA